MLLTWPLRLRSVSPTSSTISPTQKHDLLPDGQCGNLRSKRDWGVVSASQTLMYMQIIETLLKCRVWFSKSGVGPERWGLTLVQGPSLKQQEELCYQDKVLTSRRNASGPAPEPSIRSVCSGVGSKDQYFFRTRQVILMCNQGGKPQSYSFSGFPERH